VPRPHDLRNLTKTTLREVVATARTGMWPFAKLHPLPEPLPQAAHLPVVLVHGYMGHPAMMRPLARALLLGGAKATEAVAYPSMTWSFEQILAHLDTTIRAFAQQQGCKVAVVGHSMGAVATRAWLKFEGGHDVVQRFVSIGGPHAGTSLYRVVPSPVRSALDPASPFLERLNATPEPVPTFVLRARYDHQVFPPKRAAIGSLQERVIEGWGHNGLLWSPEVHLEVVRLLAETPVPLG